MIEEFLGGILQGFQLITPPGMSAEYFWPTFLLVFAIIYTLLEKTNIFGKGKEGVSEKRGIYFLIALIFAYFTASSAFATLIISKMTPQLGMIIVAMLSFLLIFGFLAGGAHPYGVGDKYLKAVMYLLMLIGAVWLAFGTFVDVTGGAGATFPVLSSADIGLIVAIVIIGIILVILLK